MLSLFSAMAAPEAGASSGGSMTTTFITFGLIIAIFYFLMIRPQRKRDKETKEMLASIKKGDKVVSIGGIHGTVMVVKENSVVVKVDDNTRLEFSRNAINSIVKPKSEPAPVAKKREKQEEAEPATKKVEAPAAKKTTAPATKKAATPAAKKATAPAAKKAAAPAAKKGEESTKTESEPQAAETEEK